MQRCPQRHSFLLVLNSWIVLTWIRRDIDLEGEKKQEGINIGGECLSPAYELVASYCQYTLFISEEIVEDQLCCSPGPTYWRWLVLASSLLPKYAWKHMAWYALIALHPDLLFMHVLCLNSIHFPFFYALYVVQVALSFMWGLVHSSAVKIHYYEH